MMSSKNVLSEWIPFDFIHRHKIYFHLKHYFATGIRPNENVALEAPCSQLGPVYLKMELTTT